MATTSTRRLSAPSGIFWTLVGIGVLAVLLAAGWRVATGAELEAKGKEWSLKVTEAADSLDAARKQLETEAQQQKSEIAKREAFWTEQVFAARAACPRAAAAPVVVPPPAPTSGAVASQKAFSEVAKTTANARLAAKEIARIKVPKF